MEKELMQHTKMTKEEERLKHILEITGCMTEEQAYRVNCNMPIKVQRHAIISLMKSGRLFYSKERDYVMNKPMYKPDKRKKRAVDVLLASVKEVDKNLIFATDYPTMFGFIKGNKCYEIVSANNVEETCEVMKQLNEEYYKTVKIEDQELVNYIVILQDKKEINYLPDVMFPYLVAVVSYYNGLKKLDVPEIKFYGKKK